MDFRRCAACGKRFRRCPQVHQQQYCSTSKCQRARRRRTQQIKRKKDPDYKDNQTRAQRAWSERNPNYWRGYRQSHPEYLERNRTLQQKRNDKRKTKKIAKMDLPTTGAPLPSGVYRLTPMSVPGIAKMNEWIVEITFISDTSDPKSNCKERTRKT